MCVSDELDVLCTFILKRWCAKRGYSVLAYASVSDFLFRLTLVISRDCVISPVIMSRESRAFSLTCCLRYHELTFHFPQIEEVLWCVVALRCLILCFPSLPPGGV